MMPPLLLRIALAPTLPPPHHIPPLPLLHQATSPCSRTYAPPLVHPPDCGEECARCAAVVSCTASHLCCCCVGRVLCALLLCPRMRPPQIDSYFSPDCLDEQMATTEAKLNRNRCLKCPQCPLCPHALATVPLLAADPSTEEGSDRDGGNGGGSEGKYFLECAHCHWSSKVVGWTGTLQELTQRLEDANSGKGRGSEQVGRRKHVLVDCCAE